MVRTLARCAFPAMLLAACAGGAGTADADADGLTDAEEAVAGSDPQAA